MLKHLDLKQINSTFAQVQFYFTIIFY